MAHFPSSPSIVHYTKAHLPLITQEIKFERKPLPPMPEITQRMNLQDRIRRVDRVRFAASAPRNRTRLRSTTPSRPAIVTLDDLTSEPELTESESEYQEGPGWRMIAKPAGEAGRSRSGGFSLEKSLGWDKDKYDKMIVSFFCQY